MASKLSSAEIFQLQADKIQYEKFFSNEPNSEFDAFVKRAVEVAINEALSEKQRLYLTLNVVQGMSMTDIGRLYGVNKATVSRTISRAKENLRKVLRYTLPRLLE